MNNQKTNPIGGSNRRRGGASKFHAIHSAVQARMAAKNRIEPTEVVIRFDRNVAPWIAGGHWHPSQTIEKLPDGSLIFRVTVHGYEEMVYWALSFGAQAEVLEPPPLRAAVAEAARQMAARYMGLQAGIGQSDS